MKCPADQSTLQIAERHGIEIDYCPDCRGVWLDRGELDKIIERADARPAAAPPPRHDDRHRGERRDRDEYEGYEDRPRNGKKRSSFLSEIFELGG